MIYLDKEWNIIIKTVNGEETLYGYEKGNGNNYETTS